ncbi:helix-turn-helix domain-containing protein [Bradyrhizobium sp.]|jgi:hypothetical protein|uniref:helix-turn-helix domain-containing protein n=1 Tax=Bradyrhizobium sp. TaxID=376 RepID=UPI003BAF1175
MALYDEKQAAPKLGLKNPGTLSNWRTQGRGPEYLKIGGAVRYSDEAIAAYLEKARRRSTSEAA